MTPSPPPASPIVAPGAGSSLPDRYTERLAQQWIADIDRRCLEITNRLIDFRDSSRLPGNPIASRRWVREYKKNGGEAVIAGWGDYFSNSRSVIIDKIGRRDIDEPDDCVRVLRWEFSSAIRGQPFPVRSHGQVAAFDRKAVSRLIKIAGVCSSRELLDFIADASRMVAMASAVAGQSQNKNWIIPTAGCQAIGLVARSRLSKISCNGAIIGRAPHSALDVVDVIPLTASSHLDLINTPPPAPGEPIPEKIIHTFEALSEEGAVL